MSIALFNSDLQNNFNKSANLESTISISFSLAVDISQIDEIHLNSSFSYELVIQIMILAISHIMKKLRNKTQGLHKSIILFGFSMKDSRGECYGSRNENKEIWVPISIQVNKKKA